MQSKIDIFTSPKEVVESLEQYRKSQGISVSEWSAGWCRMDYWTWWRIVNGQADYRYHAKLLSGLADMGEDTFLLICDLEDEVESAKRHDLCMEAYASSNRAFTIVLESLEEFKGAIEAIRDLEFLEDNANGDSSWETFNEEWEEGLGNVE
tara:strand:- start:570 stop:1022 length:453 start_codon:yes stop_codon:yes gene_type:complete